MRCLHQHLLEPRTALACAPTPSLTSTLVVARTDASPRCQMSGTGKTAHVGVHLSHQHLSDPFADAWHTIQHLHLSLPHAHERGASLLNLLTYSSIEASKWSKWSMWSKW